MSTHPETADAAQLQELLKGIRIAMLTSPEPGGELHGRPLTVQRVDADGTIWFLVAKGSEWVTPEALRQVNVAFVDADTWVSVAGAATLVTDTSVLADLGDPVSGSWFDDEHPPVAVRVSVERADYWSAPGKLAQLFHLGKAAITQQPPDMGDRGVIEP
jgi:general stress protein 26